MAKCMEKTEVYSRVVGYFRPVQQWNKGKQEEFKERKVFAVPGSVKKEVVDESRGVCEAVDASQGQVLSAQHGHRAQNPDSVLADAEKA